MRLSMMQVSTLTILTLAVLTRWKNQFLFMNTYNMYIYIYITISDCVSIFEREFCARFVQNTIDSCDRYDRMFTAHNGPVYGVKYSPFCPSIFMTYGADWKIKIWIDDFPSPLLSLCYSVRVTYSIYCCNNIDRLRIVSIVTGEMGNKKWGRRAEIRNSSDLVVELLGSDDYRYLFFVF